MAPTITSPRILVNEFKAAVRAVVKDQLHDTYAALARGEIDDIDPTSQHFKDSHRHLAELLEAIAAATGAQLPEPNPNP
jgi:acetyl-CoA carboxylase carboxyltransferase component